MFILMRKKLTKYLKIGQESVNAHSSSMISLTKYSNRLVMKQ